MRSLWARINRQEFVIALLLLTLIGLGWYDIRYFLEQPARARESEARARAVEIAARAYVEKYGQPAPPYREALPEEFAHIKVQREEDRHDYLIGFGYQLIANELRDSSGRPIPYRSGFTSFDFFRVKDDGSCEYAWTEAAGGF